MAPRLIKTRQFRDSRGWFAESYNAEKMRALGIDTVFVQDNHSYSVGRGTLRGLHFQRAPFAQTKLVRCLAGAILDVIVDLRTASPTYAKWVSAELSADNGHQLLVPVGFAHGFVTLTDDAQVAYKVDAHYDTTADAGLAWNDPALAIDWRIAADAILLSDKDKQNPPLSELGDYFVYDGAPLGSLTLEQI